MTPFKKIDDDEKERKFEAGLNDNLQKAMKLYPRDNLRVMMESARIASAIHVPSNGNKKNGNGNGAVKKKDVSKEPTEPGQRNNKRPPPSTTPKPAKKGKFLSPAEVKTYISEVSVVGSWVTWKVTAPQRELEP